MFKSKEEQAAYWTKYGKDHLVGKTIESIRWMSLEEASHMVWEYTRPIVIQFTDGSLVYPSADDEGNYGGALYGQDADGEDLLFPVGGA